MKSLDIEAVQAFVLTADLQSFTRAAEVLDMTQSAVSVKIKRLEEGLGRKLLERTPRRVRLSADGSNFLAGARALVAAHQGALEVFTPKRRRMLLGISHHIVGAELPQLLRHVGRADPGLTLDIRIAASRELLEAFDDGDIDVTIVLRHDSRRQDGKVILRENFGWFAAPDFECRVGEPIRIATQPQPCSVRAMAIRSLDAAGIAWTEAFVGGGVNTLGAAVSAGLGVAALGRRVAPRGTVDVAGRLGLPPLPARDVVLYTNLRDQQARAAIQSLTAALR
ncbi:LysR family transcriptional regulator [Pandoraea pnomenusa]|uniref:LysR family transcriptional regulator n=1 Tax=Pandoraea pnomenusa TaxID=93220 RepID=UPI00334240D3